MNQQQGEDRLKNAVPPVGENLSDEQREQMEKKEHAEHQDGKEREKVIEETRELDEH